MRPLAIRGFTCAASFSFLRGQVRNPWREDQQVGTSRSSCLRPSRKRIYRYRRRSRCPLSRSQLHRQSFGRQLWREDFAGAGAGAPATSLGGSASSVIGGESAVLGVSSTFSPAACDGCSDAVPDESLEPHPAPNSVSVSSATSPKALLCTTTTKANDRRADRALGRRTSPMSSRGRSVMAPRLRLLAPAKVEKGEGKSADAAANAPRRGRSQFVTDNPSGPPPIMSRGLAAPRQLKIPSRAVQGRAPPSPSATPPSFHRVLSATSRSVSAQYMSLRPWKKAPTSMAIPQTKRPPTAARSATRSSITSTPSLGSGPAGQALLKYRFVCRPIRGPSSGCLLPPTPPPPPVSRASSRTRMRWRYCCVTSSIGRDTPCHSCSGVTYARHETT